MTDPGGQRPAHPSPGCSRREIGQSVRGWRTIRNLPHQQKLRRTGQRKATSPAVAIHGPLHGTQQIWLALHRSEPAVEHLAAYRSARAPLKRRGRGFMRRMTFTLDMQADWSRSRAPSEGAPASPAQSADPRIQGPGRLFAAPDHGRLPGQRPSPGDGPAHRCALRCAHH